MTYSSGGLIQALDYNTFAQGGASVNHNVANINSVWGVGNGNKGYGQTTLPVLTAVAGGNDTVTATQWSTMIARLNSMLTHQSGSGSGISAPTAGTTIAYLSTLSTNITNAYNNRLTSASNGTDVTGSNFSSTWNSSTPTTFQITRTVTFASGDAARYFFNAGGKLILNISATDSLGNAKGADWVSLLGTKFASLTFAQGSNTRNGTGGSVAASNTGLGYWQMTTSNQQMIQLTSSAVSTYYGGNYIAVSAKSNGVQGSNADVGSVVTFTIDLSDVALDGQPTWNPPYNPGVGTPPSAGNFNDAVNLSITTSITIRPPESTNLTTNSWGTPTIA